MRALVLVALLASCRSESSAADAAPLQLDARPIAQHRVFGTFRREGVEWRVLVIGKIPHGELLRLARTLHHDDPNVFFDLYDDDAELKKLIDAKGNDDVLSTDWREAHAVGTIAGTVAVENASVVVRDVQLYEWRTGSTTKLR
jgi:hypothetical protein